MTVEIAECAFYLQCLVAALQGLPALAEVSEDRAEIVQSETLPVQVARCAGGGDGLPGLVDSLTVTVLVTEQLGEVTAA